jgi:hypothetical protein
MQVLVELLAAAVIAAAASALSLFGMELARSDAPAPIQLIQKTPVQANVLVVTPVAARKAQPQPC